MSASPLGRGGAGAPSRLLDLSFVTPRLAIGAHVPVHGIEALVREYGVTRVVDVRLEARDDEDALRVHGARLLHLPTEDLCAIAPEDLAEGVRWVTPALEAGERVLVHCQHGIGRSALLTACVLVAQGRSASAALAACKSARARVSPSPAQLDALLSFAGTRGPRHRVATATFEELASIAYAGLPGC